MVEYPNHFDDSSICFSAYRPFRYTEFWHQCTKGTFNVPPSSRYPETEYSFIVPFLLQIEPHSTAVKSEDLTSNGIMNKSKFFLKSVQF
jgi:hypothetical protein